jgi:hypothetical protein
MCLFFFKGVAYAGDDLGEPVGMGLFERIDHDIAQLRNRTDALEARQKLLELSKRVDASLENFKQKLDEYANFDFKLSDVTLDVVETVTKPKPTIDAASVTEAYAILGLSAELPPTRTEMRQAYKLRVLEYHPGRASGVHSKEECESMIKKINHAYDILDKLEYRATYP